MLEHRWCLLYIQHVPIYVNSLSYHLLLNIQWASTFLFYWLFNYPLTIWFDWSTFWLAYWLTNCLHHLLTGSLTDRQTDWFYNWLIGKQTDLSDCLHHWLADIQIERWTDLLTDFMTHRLIDRLTDSLIHLQPDKLNDILIDWGTHWFNDWCTDLLTDRLSACKTVREVPTCLLRWYVFSWASELYPYHEIFPYPN